MQQGTRDRTPLLTEKNSCLFCGLIISRAAFPRPWLSIEHPFAHVTSHTEQQQRTTHTHSTEHLLGTLAATLQSAAPWTLHATASLLSFEKSRTQCLLK